MTSASTWPSSSSSPSALSEPGPLLTSASAGVTRVTVLPSAASSELNAWASACATGGWRSPTVTSASGPAESRSLASAETSLPCAPSSRGAPAASGCSAGRLFATAATSARSTPSTSEPFTARRWSASEPVTVGEGSTT
ncbi:MAG: hypothetical protein IPJ65_02580 [Archangiaceae bacterium]|nr:hypothetical protein [Archangiaceae bacterium]